MLLTISSPLRAADENSWRTEAPTREWSQGAVNGKSPQFRRRRRQGGAEAYKGCSYPSIGPAWRRARIVRVEHLPSHHLTDFGRELPGQPREHQFG